MEARVIRTGAPTTTQAPPNVTMAAQMSEWLLALPGYCHSLLALAALQLVLLCTNGALLFDGAAGDAQSAVAKDATRLCGLALILGGCWTSALLTLGMLEEETQQLLHAAALSVPLALLPVFSLTSPSGELSPGGSSFSGLASARLICAIATLVVHLAIASLARPVAQKFGWRSLKRYGANRPRNAATAVLLSVSAAWKADCFSSALIIAADATLASSLPRLKGDGYIARMTIPLVVNIGVNVAVAVMLWVARSRCEKPTMRKPRQKGRTRSSVGTKCCERVPT